VIDVVEILTHWYAGRSQNELATSLGVDRKTLRKYTAPAVAAGMTPGGPQMSEADWRRLVTEWFSAVGRPAVAAGVVAVDRASPRLHRRAAAGRGDGRDDPSAATRRARPGRERGQRAPLGAGETCPRTPRRGQVTVLRDTPPPGVEAQID